MKIKDIIRLLILNKSQNDAEEIIKLFRNSGYPTRAHRLSSNAELEQLLKEDPWDLLISDDAREDFSLQQATETIVSNKADIPVLLLSSDDSTSMSKAIETGAQDMVSKTDQQHLLHAALREIANRRARLDNNTIRSTLEELQARYELLMGGSQDAIAYITDGMHVDVNDAYASQFGYDNAEDMACMPVVDLIADPDQESFKQFLRDYSHTGEKNVELEIRGQHQQGSELNLQFIFSPASYEGEECTQIIIRAGGTASSAGQDFRQSFADLAQQAVQLKNSQTEVCLAYLQIDNLMQLREAVGILAADSIFAQLQEVLSSHCPTALMVAQVTLDGYILLLPGNEPESARKTVEQLLDTIQQHIFETDGLTTHCECIAAVMAVNHKAAESADTLVKLVYTGIIELMEQAGEQKSCIYTPPAAPIKLGSKDIDLDELFEEGRLDLLYQPVVSLRGEPGEYYEVTAILKDTDGSPIDVNHLAAGMLDDKHGSQFDRWMIFATTKRLAQQRRPGATDTRLIINVSNGCLRDSNLVNWLGVSLNAAGLPAEALAFQLGTLEAENSLKLTERFFAALNKLGCNTSLRDFDSAVDGRKILEHTTPGMVKISPQAVEQAQSDEKGRHKLKQLLNEATQAEAANIVPNVCNAATLATLWQLGAAFIQGSYLQDPSPAMEYEFAEIA